MSKRIAVLLVIVTGAVALAQRRPDFTGVWEPGELKTSAPAAAGGAAGLPPSDLTIHDTPAALSVSRTAFDTVTTQTYKLDGSENTTKTGAVTRLSRAHWDGPRLIIEGKASQVTSAGYEAWTFKDTYWIDARGKLSIQVDHTTSEGKTTTRTMEYSRKKSK